MHRLPRIAIVGRPNVGKSTLLNRLVGSRVSIVEPTAGVTRDRIGVVATLSDGGRERTVEVLDTGGIGVVDRDDLGTVVEEQVAVALAAADVVLFVVDARDGVTPLDEEVARRLRGLGRPLLLLANKAEGEKPKWNVDEFRRLGLAGDPLPISAQNGDEVDTLLEWLLDHLPEPVGEESRPAPSLRLAVVGRRNAGKSTFVNRLAREDRMIVSELPGTTRDAVDVVFDRDGETFVVIDTAGVRKKSSIEHAIEFFSDARAHKAIRRADVVLLLFDASVPLSGLEKRLARYAVDHYKSLILGANKWDLCEGRMEPADLEAYLAAQLPGLAYAPVSFLSGKRGFHVDETLSLARELDAQASARISTGELNRVLEGALLARSPSRTGYRVRLKYATQADRRPPTFVLFVNDRKLVGKDYLRYLENRIRDELPFKEVPVRIVLRDSDDEGPAAGARAGAESRPREPWPVEAEEEETP